MPATTITLVRDSARARPRNPLPPTGARHNLAVLGAELRTEMAELSGSLRVEMAELRMEMRDLTTQQTHALMVGLVLSITALAITQIVLATLA